MRMHLDVQRRTNKILMPSILSRGWGGAILVVVIIYVLGVPSIARARTTIGDDAPPLLVVSEPLDMSARSTRFASLDVVNSIEPDPPTNRSDDDLAVEISATNGQLFLQRAASVAKATTAITSTVRVAVGNVRLNPTTDSTIVGTVHDGDVVNVLGVSEGWYLVDLTEHAAQGSSIKGEVAWVSEILIDRPTFAPLLAASPASAYRWLGATDARTIYDTGGVLHLRVTDDQARVAVSSSVTGRASDLAPAKEISFTLTLHWSKGHAPGGSIFHTTLGDGRDFQMRVGPGEGYPWVDFAVDDEFIDGSGTGFPVYTPTAVQFVWNGTELVASVAGEELARVASAEPMTALRIAIETQPGCVFHLTVGDMTVTNN